MNNQLCYVIADHGVAKFYAGSKTLGPVELIEVIENTHAREMNSDLSSDRPGTSFSRMGYGFHPESPKVSTKEHLVENHARAIAEKLSEFQSAHDAHGVVIAADPKLLGMIRSFLDKKTKNRVTRYINKHLTELNEKELHEAILKIT